MRRPNGYLYLFSFSSSFIFLWSCSSQKWKVCFLLQGGSQETYAGCVIAVPAPDALSILDEQATHEEIRVHSALQYVYSFATYYANECSGACSSRFMEYWRNHLPFLATLNAPEHTPWLNGQAAILSDHLLHQNLCSSLMKSKGREEFGSVEHTTVGIGCS
ncbi:hypothetical protein NE237_013850 [Protea cynaroides]|uniref:Uncharacterized protein n=1 Tax=Protea cynaroides TaxID=273540 RepID=A0A9Q0GZF2_9MAGN|nr:hypothetical protein NE237_013850 [Protea cynaroides]